MPWTLYRYILKDLLRLLVLSTTALVGVMAFAVAIKPMSEGLLGAASLPRYLGFMTPLCLVIVLPFGAAFAAAMVFTRLTNDSEVLACRASGMSYTILLLPVIAVGMGLMVGLYALSNYLVPRFYKSAELMLQADLTRLVVAQVRKGQPVLLRDWVLYADAADDTQPPPTIPDSAVQPGRLIMLRGVAVGRVDDRGRLRSDSTAERADVLVWNLPEATWVTLQLRGVTHFEPESGQMVRVASSEVPPLRVPNHFDDKTMFLSLAELRNLAVRPEAYGGVRNAREQLLRAYAGHQLRSRLERALRDERARRSVTMIGPTGDRYRLKVPGVGRVEEVLTLETGPAGEAIVVEREVDGAVVRRSEAQRGELRVVAGDPDPEPRIQITLQDVREVDTRLAGVGTEHSEVLLPRLRWGEPISSELSRRSTFELVGLAQAESASAPLREAVGDLRFALSLLGRKVVSQFHNRAAVAVAAMLVTLFGAVLAMWLKGSLPLVVFGWSALAAFVTLMVVRGGENFAVDLKHPLTLGLALTWAGNLALACAVAVVFGQLRRT